MVEGHQFQSLLASRQGRYQSLSIVIGEKQRMEYVLVMCIILM